MSAQIEDASKVVEAVSKLLEAVPKFITAAQSPETVTRSNPLQIIGRLLLGLVIITGLAGSASGLIDWYSASAPHWSTYFLRATLALMVLACLAFSIVLTWYLAKHPALLINPVELAPTVQAQWLEETSHEPKVAKASLEKASGAKIQTPPISLDSAEKEE